MSENIIIVGASIENLGAESMTAIALEYVKKMMPEADIFLVSSDKKGMSSKVHYKVLPTHFPTVTFWNSVSLMGMVLKSRIGDVQDKEYEKVIQSTKAIIDICGYSFSTKWGIQSVYSYYQRIYTAKKLGIKYYIFSQSFGPIQYTNMTDRVICEILGRILFKYPEHVHAREHSSYKCMMRYCMRNLYYKPDMVLLYEKEIDYSILRKNIAYSGFEFELNNKKKKAAIIPNQQVLWKTENGEVYQDILVKIIERLMEKSYDTYLILHCKLDLGLCHYLINKVNSEKLIFIDTTVQGSDAFQSLVKAFDFIVSSRYHAIIHAYRQNIPALVLGWEEKYRELAKLMKQTEFYIDCRRNISLENAEKSLIKLEESCIHQKKKIHHRKEWIREKYNT